MNRTRYALVAGMLVASGLHAQFFEELSTPKVTVNLVHPPGLGLKIKRIAFGPSTGECSDTVIDMLTERLVHGGVEVVDRQNLQTILAEHHFNLSGYVDQSSVAELGKILGPTALVFVKLGRCTTERQSLYEDGKLLSGASARVQIARTRAFVQGSVQTVDLTTGKIFAAQSISHSPQRENRSTTGTPEFPSEMDVKDEAIRLAAFQATKMLMSWTEQKMLYFHDNKECGLKTAFEMLKTGELGAAFTQSSANLDGCKTAKVKPAILGHAYYNLGLMYLLGHNYEKARANLLEASRLRPGKIVQDAIIECNRSAALAQQMLRVEQRTAAFEASRAPAPSPATSAQAKAGEDAKPSIEDRLRSVDSLFKKGIITKDEYDAKKAQILKDM